MANSIELDQQLSSYDYELPEELIAQTPAVPRDSSRLLVIDSPLTQIHTHFYQLPEWLLPGDLLVLNNTETLRARLYGHKTTGAQVEVLLLEEGAKNCWLALVKPGKRFQVGGEIIFDAPEGMASEVPLKAKVIATDEATGGRWLQFLIPPELSFQSLLASYGEVPLPPYITSKESDASQYQTVYAKRPGAVAAPTAGLHFTEELLQRLQDKGIQTAYVTLHVGVGTFRPVEVENIKTHQMHSEWVDVSLETVRKIEETKAAGGRIIAVGTTTVRSLEGAAQASEGKLAPFCGKTELFIYPGYRFCVVEGLITNFHLPRSSLLMLVSALIGRPRLLDLYAEAIAQRYRFYSFGDAMLILPSAYKKG